MVDVMGMGWGWRGDGKLLIRCAVGSGCQRSEGGRRLTGVGRGGDAEDRVGLLAILPSVLLGRHYIIGLRSWRRWGGLPGLRSLDGLGRGPGLALLL
jgi:hypothetical protein